MSINDSETVTGYYTESAGTQGCFVRSADGVVETFQVPGSILTEPVGINTAGEVVGYFELTAGVPQAFIRSADGQITTLRRPYGRIPHQ
jgi:probable HAF family extracellular repeat protein